MFDFRIIANDAEPIFAAKSRDTRRFVHCRSTFGIANDLIQDPLRVLNSIGREIVQAGLAVEYARY